MHQSRFRSVYGQPYGRIHPRPHVPPRGLPTGLPYYCVREYSLKTAIRQIHGNWNLGYVLDKHSISSVPIGEDAYGRMRFETIRTDVGEALYQLKYQRDWSQVDTLAGVLATALYPKFQNVGLVIPMVASTTRNRQPVTEIAHALGKIVSLPCFDNLLLKSPNNKSLKNLNTKAEKVEALQGTLSVNEAAIGNEGGWMECSSCR